MKDSDQSTTEGFKSASNQKSGSTVSKKIAKQGFVKTKVQARNEKIQGTNDSSIVSKRSVERLYWSKRAPGINGRTIEDSERVVEFFRPFVGKPQRRSPTINRGYWTRMEAIMNHIEHTISSTSTKKTVIVGLGAGFDPYPFQYLHNHQTNENDPEIVFLDVDFPDLIKRKVDMIKHSKEVTDIIGAAEPIQDTLRHAVQLQTKSYIALGCDLTKLDDLSKTLSLIFDLNTTLLTFTAEVSITYMPRKEADDVIQWASTFPHSRFVLLEQILPAGPNHPFAKTMLKHFNNLNTPLNSVLTYQKVSDQITRYKSRGWQSVQASSLYDFYEHSITREQKDFLDTIEAFDEWEEFVLFCQHYVILYASTEESDRSPLIKEPQSPSPKSFESSQTIEIETKANTSQYHKKFGAGCLYTENQAPSILSNGGVYMARTNDSVLISPKKSDKLIVSNETFKERMCHSLAHIKGTGDIILTGGRMAPNKPLLDCWKLSGGSWRKIADLPQPRFRHHTFVTQDNNVVVFGGKSSGNDSLPWLIYNTKSDSWKELVVTVDSISDAYSSAVAWDEKSSSGYIFGGFDRYDTLRTQIFKFTLVEDSVKVENISSLFDTYTRLILSRLGAKAFFLRGKVYIVGGITNELTIDLNMSVAELDPTTNTVCTLKYSTDTNDMSVNLPLYVGFNLDLLDDVAVIYGGGAVCFSFGSYWNNVATLRFPESKSSLNELHIIQKSTQLVSASSKPEKHLNIANIGQYQPVNPGAVKALNIADVGSSFDDFLKNVYSKQTPAVLKNLNLGSCLTKWTDPNYLANSSCGEDDVIVHVSEEKNMNFVAKNFEYKTMKFNQFISTVFDKDSHKKVYLRSLSANSPKNKPAIFSEDFSGLSNDFQIPEPIANLQNIQFSSPFRITSPDTAIWLHYDVTANILFQVVGRKTVRLYPPSDAQYLSFPAGSSTSLIDNIFEFPTENLAGPTHPIEIELGPGDAIFIPACWLHATRSKEPSISINFFWKDLDNKVYAAGKDVYGNRDLAAYENGRQVIQKLVNGLDDGHPKEVRKFYLQRLAQELKDLAENI